jgi:hypothetical protein
MLYEQIGILKMINEKQLAQLVAKAIGLLILFSVIALPWLMIASYKG